MANKMAERDEQRESFIIRGKSHGDNFADIVAAVAVRDGKGGIAADERITVAMLAILCRRHGLPAAATGGAFDLNSETFIRGDGGTDFNALRETLDAGPSADVFLYTYGLLKALAAELTSNQRWDLP